MKGSRDVAVQPALDTGTLDRRGLKPAEALAEQEFCEESPKLLHCAGNTVVVRTDGSRFNSSRCAR